MLLQGLNVFLSQKEPHLQWAGVTDRVATAVSGGEVCAWVASMNKKIVC